MHHTRRNNNKCIHNKRSRRGKTPADLGSWKDGDFHYPFFLVLELASVLPVTFQFNTRILRLVRILNDCSRFCSPSLAALLCCCMLDVCF
jgi:hypothetical protein